MKVLIFGAGALGSLLGAFLTGKHAVMLVGRQDHVDAIQREGLRVEGVRTMQVQPAAATSAPEDDAPDLVLVTVKAYDTGAAIESLQSVVGTRTTVVTAQNGLGNLEALRDAFPGRPVLAAVTTYGAMLAGPGRVLYTGRGDVLVGGTTRELDAAGRVARAFRDAGLQALGLPDIRGPLWQKAIVNAAINPLSALQRKPNGALLDDADVLARMRSIAEEGAAVARALKVALPERDTFAVVQRVARATAANRSSMLQDVEKGRRTEIEQINGAIVREGSRLGVPTPENARVLDEVKALSRRPSA
jgi:2-dehydropantoate 2-reductase